MDTQSVSGEQSNPQLPKIPENTISKWQGLVELATQVSHVNSVAILKVADTTLEVLAANLHERSHYHRQNRFERGTDPLAEAIIGTNKLLSLPDIVQDPYWAGEQALLNGALAYFGFPLYWLDGTLFGIFCLVHDQAVIFNTLQTSLIAQFKANFDKDLEILYLSSCLLNENSLNSQKQLLENLVAVARATATELTLEPTLQNVLEVSVKLTTAEHGSLFLLNADGMITHSIRGLGKAELEIDQNVTASVMEKGLAGWVARNHRLALVNDTLQDGRWLHRPNQPVTMRSALSLPLTRGEVLLGVLTLLHSDPNHFSLEDAMLLQAAADQMALALENARLYTTARQELQERHRAEQALHEANQKLTRSVAELERRAREISLLNQMSELFGACHSPQEAYTVIGQIARQIFPSESGTLYIIQVGHNLMEAVVKWGGKPGEAAVFQTDDCWALRRGRSHLMEDSSYCLGCDHLSKPLPGSSLCIPMMALGETLGVFSLAHPDTEFFSEEKRSLATTVAEQIGLALANLKLQETLRNQSVRDPLTGLFNRRYMEETLERELFRAARDQTALAVIMLDIDYFKNLNDTYKHDGGDAVLREIAQVLLQHTRQGDVVCRYGGEEFTIILPDAPLEETYRRAEELRRLVAELKVSHRNYMISTITLSQGIAVYPAHGTSKEALLLAADTALYQAKQAGRNRVVIAL